MALRLAFVGWGPFHTRLSFHQFFLDNKEQVERFDTVQNRIVLRDGTVIKALLVPPRSTDGLRFDQVIVADDRRLRLLHGDSYMVYLLRHIMGYSGTPEDYKFIVYDLDANVEKEALS